MSTIVPFQALRPEPKFAAAVASKPYDVLNSHEAREETADNPYSFLHITKSEVDLPLNVLTGGPDTYERCRQQARALRAKGVDRLIVTSAALLPGGARAHFVRAGVQPGDPHDGVVIVIFGLPDGLFGWVAAVDGRPPDDLLSRVRHYDRRR